jgi:hypothetical protein
MVHSNEKQMSAKETVYWKQRNGELISIDNMNINHLRISI